MPAGRRFDERGLADVAGTAAAILGGLALMLLGHALRAVDDQLADLGPDTDLD